MSNPTQPWEYSQPNREINFANFGHPGKWIESVYVGPNTTVDFTGSNYGVGAIVIGNHNNMLIHLSNGGTISGSAFQNQSGIIELGISKIEQGSTGYSWVLKRNQNVR